MSWIVPVPLLSLLTAKQLEQMVCGMPEISVDVLRKVVRYREVDEQHQLVQWFWHTLEEFSNEERVLFMRFVSGRSRLPANTADISQRFQIMKVDRVSWHFSPSRLLPCLIRETPRGPLPPRQPKGGWPVVPPLSLKGHLLGS